MVLGIDLHVAELLTMVFICLLLKSNPYMIEVMHSLLVEHAMPTQQCIPLFAKTVAESNTKCAVLYGCVEVEIL